MFNQTIRPRRLRTSDNLRKLVRETRISPESLIWPIFVAEGEGIYEEIPSLPGQYHYSPDQLYRMVERAHEHGVSRVILFGLPKDLSLIHISPCWPRRRALTRRNTAATASRAPGRTLYII